MVVIDTNVLLYAANRDSPLHDKARGALTEYTEKEYALTLGIVYEFLRVATHVRVFPRPLKSLEAHKFVRALVDHELCYVLLPTENHMEKLGRFLTVPTRGGNLFHDICTVTLMIENGVRSILTNDTDFLQFPEIDVINLT